MNKIELSQVVWERMKFNVRIKLLLVVRIAQAIRIFPRELGGYRSLITGVIEEGMIPTELGKWKLR